MKIYNCRDKDGHYIAMIFDASESGGSVELMYAEDDVQRTFKDVPEAQNALVKLCGCTPSEISFQISEETSDVCSASDCVDSEAERARIEAAREAAHAAGLPFYEGSDEAWEAFSEADGLVYDGNMSVEDYMLMLKNKNAAAGNIDAHKKRKTKTSVPAVMRYHKKAYKRIPLDVPKELAQQFKEKCAVEGTSYRAVLIEAIEAFLGKKQQ